MSLHMHPPRIHQYHPRRRRSDGAERLTREGAPRFRHEALFYDGECAFLEGTLPFITEALVRDEPVLVAVNREKTRLLKTALGDDVGGVHFRDMEQLGANPARIISAWIGFLRDETVGGTGARGVGEPVWPGRSETELCECRRHESLLSRAFDDGQAWRLLCTYDLDGLDLGTIEAARLNHPVLVNGGGSGESESYVESDRGLSALHGALPAPPGSPNPFDFTSEGLGRIRTRVSREAAEAGLDGQRSDDLVLAVNELATNSVLYGGGNGTLRIWREDQSLLCEVRDRGQIEDPLAGRIPPTPEQARGRGLWLVNQLCDLVQIRTSPAGSVVRVQMRLVSA